MLATLGKRSHRHQIKKKNVDDISLQMTAGEDFPDHTVRSLREHVIEPVVCWEETKTMKNGSLPDLQGAYPRLSWGRENADRTT